MNTLNTQLTRAFVFAQNGVADLKERAAEDRGAVMAEYGLLLALIAVAIIVTLTVFKNSLTSVFTSANTELNGAVPDATVGGAGGGDGS